MQAYPSDLGTRAPTGLLRCGEDPFKCKVALFVSAMLLVGYR